MVAIVAEFFGILGVSAMPPSNMAELIPYLLTIAVGLFLVSAVFKLIASLIRNLMDLRRL